MTGKDILIVGGGLGGFRIAEQLRRRGHTAGITVIGAESHPPYDRPPLSKQVLRGDSDDSAFAGVEALNVEWLLGRNAVSLDAARKTVTTDDGHRHGYDVLVLAPGGRARLLPQIEMGPGVHALRTIDDARALRGAIVPGTRLSIIGGGFIGCEVAASARQSGAIVDLVESLSGPLVRVLGPLASAKVAALHAEQGVRIHAGAAADHLRRDADGRLKGLGLSHDVVIDADAVVIGIGIVPEIDWLAGSGIELRDGIVCDGAGRTSIADVFALGDVAQWWHDLANAHRRVEHWTTTTDQAAIVAANILRTSHEPIATLTAAPYFWSDQYAVKIQGIGFIDPTQDVTEIMVRDRSVLLYADAGIVRGVVGFSIPGAVMRTKPLIERAATIDEAISLLSN